MVEKKDAQFRKLGGSREIDADKRIEETPEGSHITKISSEETAQKREGMRIQTSSGIQTHGDLKSHRPGIWLPKKINLSDWLKWAISTLKAYAKKFWGRDLEVSAESVEQYELEIENLLKELNQAQLKKEELEHRLQENQKSLSLALKLIDSLEVYTAKLEELKQEIDKSKKQNLRNETEVKKVIREQRWILSIDCEVNATEQSVDNQASIDLHVKTESGQDKIFEFKSPNLNPFSRGKKTGRLRVTKEFAEGLNQLIQYMKKTEVYSNLSIESEGTYKVPRAIGVLVMGVDLPPAELQLIEEWNFHLRPHIYIMTYNELIKNAERQLQNIRYAREKDAK